MTVSIRFVLTVVTVIFTTQCQPSTCFSLNQTGGSFPNSVYQQSTFSYNFIVPNASVSYYGPSSAVGKCNIMGYWHTSNSGSGGSSISFSVKNRDRLICTDKCTSLICGYNPIKNVTYTVAGKTYTGLTIRPDSKSRMPLTDIGASDGLLSAADYLNFPDLQMLPALAGAVVPIYNIPELERTNITAPLILSRSSLVNIFMGNIRLWDDPSILLDNAINPKVIEVLKKITQPISIVVRTDSSGISEVFSAALGAMSPSGMSITQQGQVPSVDNSFYDQITPIGPSQTPNWCGPLTDELQYVTITNCPFSSSSPSSSSTIKPILVSSKTLRFIVVDSNYNLQNVSFNCDFSANQIKSAIFLATNLDVNINILNLSSILHTYNTIQIEVGYKGLLQQGKNMFNPILVSSPVNVGVTIISKQEGGYLNTVSTCTGNPSTLQKSSLWLRVGIANKFKLKWTSEGNTQSTGFITYSGNGDISSSVMTAINTIASAAATSVTMITHGSWTEFRIVFSASTLSQFSTLSILTPFIPTSVYVNSYMGYNNYPCFYDVGNPTGYQGSGRYTCYKRQTNFTSWSYYSGFSNPGVVAEVLSRPYSIGYSVLEIALSQKLPTASMINKAGSTVTATSASVAFAIMDKGGSLNSLLQASLADGSSSNVWPISGFTYFIIRNNHHIDPGNCARRSSAMEYLYKFYASKSIETATVELGFAVLPHFMADSIVEHLIDNAMCENGEYALEKYRPNSSPIYGVTVFKNIIDRYINAYSSIDATASWSFDYNDDSNLIWNNYIKNPKSVTSVFTMFIDKNEKLINYNKNNDILTSSFANVAVVFLYHLNAYTDMNLLTGNDGKNPPLQLTSEIIGEIFAGKITKWDDPKIKLANLLTSKYLPNLLINVVIRPDICDTNGLLIRFLKTKSKVFLEEYSRIYNDNNNILINGNNDDNIPLNQFNFSTLIPKSRLKYAYTNDRSDSIVTTYDGSFGYFLQYEAPTSAIANFCPDSNCSNINNIINPSLTASIISCENDLSVIINPRDNLNTYDLMSSNAVGCYPIVGTIDYSLLTSIDPLTCSNNYNINIDVDISNSSSLLKDRISLSSWLYSSSIITKPLAINSVAASSDSARLSTYQKICNIKCNNREYGYQYCNYRDCSWSAGDYTQKVSGCDPDSQTHTVTYELILGTSATCIKNIETIPPSSIIIGCTDVQSSYQYGKLAKSMSIIGMVICSSILIFVFINRNEKVIIKSQAIFIYIFIIGAFLMNLTILAYLGNNSDENCLLRVWAFDISSTIMFAPLLMKLHRVDMLFRMSKKLRKVKIKDSTVAFQVFYLVCVDILILSLWTALNRPRQRTHLSRAGGLYVPVEFNVCSTDLEDPFEQCMLAWKAFLLAAGVYKSICTWDMPSDLAEVKHFFLAIYNVSVVGGAMYFFSLYGANSQGSFVILRCVGIFVSATLPVLIIIIPKFIVIQYKLITGKKLWAHSKIFVSRISSGNGGVKSRSIDSADINSNTNYCTNNHTNNNCCSNDNNNDNNNNNNNVNSINNNNHHHHNHNHNNINSISNNHHNHNNNDDDDNDCSNDKCNYNNYNDSSKGNSNKNNSNKNNSRNNTDDDDDIKPKKFNISLSNAANKIRSRMSFKISPDQPIVESSCLDEIPINISARSSTVDNQENSMKR